MKRTFKSLAVLALSALAMVSCQKELLSPATQEGQEVEVSLDLTTPLMGTKSYADGNTVNVVHVHVYQKNASGNLTYIAPAAQGAAIETPSKDVEMSNGAATYKTRLVTGQTYTFVFWAEKSGNGYYTYDSTNKTVTVNYANAVGNDESRDAFYAVLPNVTITGAYSKSVTLNRPFAQINFGASDDEVAKAAGITVTGAAVKLTGIANSINLLDGTVSGSETVTFANADLPTDPATLSAAGENYKYVAMDYVLVGKNAKTLSDVTLTLTLKADGTLSTTPEHKYPNVPLQGNYRTNIIGYLFTSPADIQITVDPEFGDTDENIVAQNVASIAAANGALSNGATAVTIANVTASEAETTKLQMPATSENITVTVENIESTANLQIEKPATGSNPESVSVVLPASASVSNLTINLPDSHVEVNGATYNSITATTSDNTLVIGSDVKVTTLTIEAGAVEIYGEVGTLTNNGSGAVKVWAVGDKATFNKAYTAGAQTIELKNDIKDFTDKILISRSLVLKGNGHEIWNTFNRVIGIEDCDGSVIEFNNIGLISKCTESSDVRGISFYNVSNTSVTLDNSTVSASFYALNFTATNDNLNVVIKNATVAAGWAAINSYANNSTFTIENSTLRGLNDKGESSWNDFATIVFDGNGLGNANNIGVAGSGNTLNVANSTIYASSESTNNQAWLALQYGAQRNMVKVDSATKIIDDSDNDKTSNIRLLNYVNYTSPVYYDLESEIWIGGSFVYPGYEASIGSNYYVTLAEALAAVQAGETVQILKSGEYALEKLTGANYTLEAVAEGVVLKHTPVSGSWIADCTGTVTVKNLTWDVGVVNYQYFKNVDVENCTIKGCPFAHTKVNFKSCNFVVESNEDYNIWTYAADIVFDDCTFNCAGKSVLVYKEKGTNPYKVTLNNCVFNASQSVTGKAAIEIDSSLNPYEVYINNCTQTGFADGSVSQNPLWNNKKGDSSNLKVVVNGVEQTL